MAASSKKKRIDLNDESASSNSAEHGNSSVTTTSTNRSTSLLYSFHNILPAEIDTFGFYLETKQFCIVLLLATFMLGFSGSIIFLAALGLYTILQRRSSRLSGPSSGTRSGGAAMRWKGNGANVKGMKDLPKSPQGG